MVIRIVQLQLLALFVYILCDWLAGPKDAVKWFVAASLTLSAFAIYSQIIRHRQR